VGRLDARSDRSDDLGPQGIEVDLGAEPHREAVEAPHRVVSPPVEPAIDGRLDAPAQRLEERDNSERCDRYREAIAGGDRRDTTWTSATPVR